MSIEISPTGKAVGAEIRGLDLSQPVSDADVEKVDEALNAYGVIFFRDQTLAPEQQLDLTWHFGALAPNTFGETHGLRTIPALSSFQMWWKTGVRLASCAQQEVGATHAHVDASRGGLQTLDDHLKPARPFRGGVGS